MNDLPNPLVRRYLDQLAAALAACGMEAEDREAIAREIGSHAAEAVARGERLVEVLERLGAPARLAEAYAAEAFLRPPRAAGGSSPRGWSAAALARLTRPAALVSSVLLALAGSLLALGGSAGALLGLVGPWLPIDPTLRFGWPQLVVILTSLLLLAAGAALLRVARWNLALVRRINLPRR
jgi:hypothetical protein